VRAGWLPSISPARTVGELVGVLFLLLEVLSIGYARFVPERFFCWAPFDFHAQYVIEVDIGGDELTRAEIRRRYRFPPVGWDPSIHNVFSIIAQYESTDGAFDDARVRVDSSVNGHPREEWNWPPP
jgi:hypothetical protein